MPPIDQFTALARDAATKLGLVAEHLWPQMVLYTWAQALAALVVNGLLLVTSACFLAFTFKTWLAMARESSTLEPASIENPSRDDDTHAIGTFWKKRRKHYARNEVEMNPTDYGVLLMIVTVVGGVICTFGFFVSLHAVGDAIPAFLAPEGATVMNMVQAATKK